MYDINWGLERRDPGNMSAGKLTQPYYIFQDLNLLYHKIGIFNKIG